MNGKLKTQQKKPKYMVYGTTLFFHFWKFYKTLFDNWPSLRESLVEKKRKEKKGGIIFAKALL